MTHEDHFRRLENMFASAPIHKLIQTRINITEGRAEVTLPVEEKLFHAAGAVHGAIYFMALDNAAFFAANSLVRDAFVLTSNFNIYLLRPIAEGAISAVGTVVARSRSQIVAEAVACNAKGREIARGSGVFVPGKTALSPEIGYC
jgi:uncharacterized protein (TIGR00369 family)